MAKRPRRRRKTGNRSSNERGGRSHAAFRSVLRVLCCEDASYMTGQTLHPNGGNFVAT
jgi:hypothetical protein